MSKQGKMHSSPFHIESSLYKYAIEHENDGYIPPSNLADCEHRKVNQMCRLWNSGFEQCASFKCRYYKKENRTAGASCTICAYYFNSKCTHHKRPNHIDVDVSAAGYCKFLITEQSDRKKFLAIRQYKMRIFLTTQMDRKKHLIKSRKKYIQQSKKEMDRIGPTHNDYKYLEDKIASRERSIPRLEQDIIRLQSELIRLGGELREKPPKKK